MGLRLILPVLAVLLGSAAPSVNAAPRSAVACPARPDLAQLVRDADMIVLAEPLVPAEELRTAITESSPRYLQMPLNRVSLLKGRTDSPEITVRFFSEDTHYSPKLQLLLDLSGKSSILFLNWADEGTGGIYLSQSPDALQPHAPSAVAEIKAELERQRQILLSWKPRSSLPHYDRIRRLLAGLPMASRQRQMSIFRELEKLGKSATPALIAQMDDRRPLAHREISLANHSLDAFEGIRHYGPELVVDAIDAILNQLDGHGGSIVNGGSERERRNAVAAWRVYDADRACRAT